MRFNIQRYVIHKTSSLKQLYTRIKYNTSKQIKIKREKKKDFSFYSKPVSVPFEQSISGVLPFNALTLSLILSTDTASEPSLLV